jgi:hypothetical protein
MKQAVVLLIALLVVTSLRAQTRHDSDSTKPEAERPASDAHSFMELFSKLERDVALAAQKQDRDFLDLTVAPEFVERDATDPDHLIPRTDWIPNSLRDYNLDPLSIHSLVIRAFLGTAIVSFAQRPKASQAADHSANYYFVVDVWAPNHGKWQLTSRFLSPVPVGPERGHP